ncbi:MAG TPA: hypothetical protein VJ986_13600 [Gaiellaceae bacterium]|nr:hypothetical protein [Gaiellaceae bacterium]
MRGRVPVVLSLVALVVSLLSLTQRGTAQTLLPPHSVGTAQLRNGAVTAAKVRAHSLLKRNFKRGQLPAGPRGLPGAPGPSDAYSASLVGPAPVAVRDTPATLAELEIPQAGSYVVEASAYFESSGTGIASLTCVLDTLEGTNDEVRLLAGNPTPVALSVVHTYAGPGAVDLSCAGRAPADAYSIRITAIRVGTLTYTGLAQSGTP